VNRAEVADRDLPFAASSDPNKDSIVGAQQLVRAID
jgi:hypothetical protein